MSTNSTGRHGQEYSPPQQQYQSQPFDSHTSSKQQSNFQTQQYSAYEEIGGPQSFPLRGFGNDFPNIPPNPLSQFLAGFLRSVVDLSINVSHELYTNSSVIVLAAGLAGSVHHFASPLNSLANAAMDAGFHGSVAVAKYVGLAFLIKTALTPIHEAFTCDRTSLIANSQRSKEIAYEVAKVKVNINSHVVSYLTPMALAWIVAYTKGIPVRLGTATVYTMGTFGIMKLLSRGYDYALTKWGQRERESY